MQRTYEQARFARTLVLFLVVLNIIAMECGFTTNPKWYKLMYCSFPLLIISIIAYRGKLR